MPYHFHMGLRDHRVPWCAQKYHSPLHATVFASTPSLFTYQTLLQGILDGVPSAAARLAIMLIAYLYVAFMWIGLRLGMPDHIGDLAPRSHEDPARRIYIYGPADRITRAADVEHNADEAEPRGFLMRREVFDGS